MQTHELKKRLDDALSHYARLQAVWRAHSDEAIGTVPCPHEWGFVQGMGGHVLGMLSRAKVPKPEAFQCGFVLHICIACGAYALQASYGENGKPPIRRRIAKRVAYALEAHGCRQAEERYLLRYA